MRQSRITRLCSAALLSWLLAQPAAAQEHDRVQLLPLAEGSATAPGLTPDYFWVTASASLLAGGLGGLFALRVLGVYDRAKGLPLVSPERAPLRREAQHLELTADAFFAGAVVLAAGSLVMALFTNWSSPERQAPRAIATLQLAPSASPHGAALCLRGALP